MKMRAPFVVLSAAAILMLASTYASASRMTAPSGTVYTGTFGGEAENGHVVLHNPAARIECSSGWEGVVTDHGATVTVEGPVTFLGLVSCTGGWTASTNVGGSFVIHPTSNGNGTFTSTGLTITTVNDLIGITCRYATLNSDLGSFTGAQSASGHATIDLSGSLTLEGGSIFCGQGGSTAAFTGSYKIPSPTGATVDS